MCGSISKPYLVLIQYIIFYHQYNYVTALIGPNIRQAEENEFPAVVSIMKLRNTSRSQIEIYNKCTGTLVSRQDVIIAQHCLEDLVTIGFRVMVGSRDLRQTIAYSPIFIWTYENWILYKQRNLELSDHDIAFIKISANVPENIQFAPTANIPNENLYGMHVDAAGWGVLNNGTAVRILQTGKLRIMTFIECQINYLLLNPSLNYIHKKYLCTVADPHILLTEGDSGGPIFFFGTLVAVNKGVFPVVDAGARQPYLMNLHVSLRYYREFFDNVISTFHLLF